MVIFDDVREPAPGVEDVPIVNEEVDESPSKNEQLEEPQKQQRREAFPPETCGQQPVDNDTDKKCRQVSPTPDEGGEFRKARILASVQRQELLGGAQGTCQDCGERNEPQPLPQ